MYKLIDGINEDETSVELILRINRICNQKCIFCFAHIDNVTFFSFDIIIETIEQILKKYNGKEISITISGGEPTLHKYFFNILDFCEKNNITILLQTNRVFFSSKNNVEKLKKYKKIELFISFHSHKEKVYNAITYSNTYKLAIKGIKNLYNNGIKLELNIVLNIFNYKYIAEYLLFVNNLFKSKIKLNISIMASIKKYSYYNKILFKYSDVINKINSVEKIIKDNIIISNVFGGECDFPFCIGEKLFYFKRESIGKNNFGKGFNRIKLEECKDCYYYNSCRGISTEYNNKFGFEEFKPIKLIYNTKCKS
ncbi:MAG: radical SAM protein [Candidatus Gracilibacteria bacterium]|nr:radical SAM protein [Candidatus Gracilibacteria bacterium]